MRMTGKCINKHLLFSSLSSFIETNWRPNGFDRLVEIDFFFLLQTVPTVSCEIIRNLVWAVFFFFGQNLVVSVRLAKSFSSFCVHARYYDRNDRSS